jgi:hypothetical protein
MPTRPTAPPGRAISGRARGTDRTGASVRLVGSLDQVTEGYRAMNEREVLKFQIEL